MARRQMRAFTLAHNINEELDNLAGLASNSPEHEVLRSLQPEKRSTELPPLEPIDDHGLTTKDYEALYALFPAPSIPVKARFTHVTDLRKLDWDSFLQYSRRYMDIDAYPRINERRKLNRRVSRKHTTLSARSSQKRADVLNTSRIVDALLSLGLSSLKEQVKEAKERVASLEPQRNTGTNVSEGKNKLSNRSRRKAVTVRAV